MKREKKKPEYSLLSNLKFIMGIMWKWQKGQTVLLFLRSPFIVLSSFLGIYLSKEVVAAVTQNKVPQGVITVIFSVSIALILSLCVEKFLHAHLQKFMMIFDFRIQLIMLDKCITSDYENMESPEGLTRVSKAMENSGNGDSGTRLISYVLSSFIANVIGVTSYATLLFALSPWILITLSATTLSGFLILKMTSSWSYCNKDKWKTYDRKLDYLRGNASDFTKAKDIRLYGMGDWFKDVFADTLSGRMQWYKKEQLYYFKADWLRALLSLIRDGAAYGLLVYLLFKNNLTVADFVLYFGIIGGFAVWLNGIVEDFSNLNRFNLGFCELREYLDYPDKANYGNGLPVPKETFSIEFRNVSYRYAGNKEDTIKNLSFVINKGEKLAIVGLNGAGKTTLVKLICGLYTPTQGEILIDGNPINTYNRREYYSLFSVVFQDIFILPLSVACNVSAAIGSDIDRQKVEKVLSLAGLLPKIHCFPNGMDTRLIKSVYDDAVDLSGGELQKLALARALYKNGKALILDEPTAALDPIAENNIYMQYNSMTSGHTSVFISHRLASTRFCDRIFFLENGIVAEYGSHDELMVKRGKYYEMYEVQSHYYREEAAKDAC